MSDNLPTLYKNVLSGLPTDYAGDVFLWATDKFPNDRFAYKAEAFAREADRLMPTIGGMVDLAREAQRETGQPELSETAAGDLLAFIAQRYANYRIGGNVKTQMPRPE